jgi:hypothetical protein
MRYSDHDHTLHEYATTATDGLHLLGPAPLGEGLLTGRLRPLPLDWPRGRAFEPTDQP